MSHVAFSSACRFPCTCPERLCHEYTPLNTYIIHCACCANFDPTGDTKLTLLMYAHGILSELFKHTDHCECDASAGDTSDPLVVCPEAYNRYARKTKFDKCKYASFEQWVHKISSHALDVYKGEGDCARPDVFKKVDKMLDAAVSYRLCLSPPAPPAPPSKYFNKRSDRSRSPDRTAPVFLA